MLRGQLLASIGAFRLFFIIGQPFGNDMDESEKDIRSEYFSGIGKAIFPCNGGNNGSLSTDWEN